MLVLYRSVYVQKQKQGGLEAVGQAPDMDSLEKSQAFKLLFTNDSVLQLVSVWRQAQLLLQGVLNT